MHRRFRFDRIIRSKRVMRWALVFLFVAISSMTIVYASLSTTLSIRGSAEFKDASWDIVVEEMEMYDGYNFTKDGNAALYGSAKLLNRPTILGTSITNFNIEIAQKGDSAILAYKVKNNGQIPAMLDSVTYANKNITSAANNYSDVQLVNNYLEFYPHFYYCRDTEACDIVGVSAILCPGAEFELYVTTGFNSSATKFPTSKVTVSNLGVDINFIAADQSECDGSIPTNGAVG